MKGLFCLGLCLTFCVSAFSRTLPQQENVQSFIGAMVSEHHYNRQTLEALFDQVKLKPSIIKAMNRPYESMTWKKYRDLFLTKTKIANGVTFWKQHQTLLSTISKKYQVNPEILVATVGVEAAYGKNTGTYRVMDALSTLAFDYPRRAPFFQNELEQYLLFIRRYNIKPFSVYGSYAGAIGQPQFMPSNIRKFAVDYTKQHTIDLSHNEADVLASIANYYHHNTWRYNQPIATRAILTHSAKHNIQNYLGKTSYTINALHHRGIAGETPLPSDTRVSIIQLKSKNTAEYWLGLHNFYVITRYNPSDFYAMVVYQLAQKIKTRHYTTRG